jgi:hypothetical protein
MNRAKRIVQWIPISQPAFSLGPQLRRAQQVVDHLAIHFRRTQTINIPRGQVINAFRFAQMPQDARRRYTPLSQMLDLADLRPGPSAYLEQDRLVNAPIPKLRKPGFPLRRRRASAEHAKDQAGQHETFPFPLRHQRESITCAVIVNVPPAQTNAKSPPLAVASSPNRRRCVSFSENTTRSVIPIARSVQEHIRKSDSLFADR